MTESSTRRWSRRRAGALLTAALALSAVGVARAATTDPNPSERELANAELSRRAATEGMVLLENAGALPMASSGNVALFGRGAYATVKGGTGSGDVNSRYVINVRQGFDDAGFDVTTDPDYWDELVASPVEVPLTPDTAEPTAPTDTAVFVLARNSGEGGDRDAEPGDYYLTDTERQNLAILGATYPDVVVALNVGAVVDTSFFDEVNAEVSDPDGGQGLDSLLLMSQPGQEAGHALVDVLTGAVTPSGKTVDTWASAYDYYPAAPTFSDHDGLHTPEVYTEGVYVGYRYFDSFYESIEPTDPASVVNYPFGYGLSYTTFDVKTQRVRADMDAVTVQAKVTNTGDMPGKEVVEVYFSAPQTGLDKPYQELGGYAKTDLLDPGASQTLTISFDTTTMASYDEARAAYVMDAGDYLIRVGSSSRDTSVEAKVRLGSTVVTEQLSTQFDDQTVDDWVADPGAFYSYPDEAKETKTARVVPLHTKGFQTADNASPLAQSVAIDESSGYYPLDGSLLSATTAYTTGEADWEGTGAPYQAKTGEAVEVVDAAPGATLFDVAKGDVSMEQFVAGLSVEQLSTVAVGVNFLQSIIFGPQGSTYAPRGGAGLTTPDYEDLGIPQASLVDGPAGVRISQSFNDGGVTYYQWTTAWPIGTMLAQTWNRDLVQQVGVGVGVELVEFGATMWLAPGMNIHRDPLNGRNFEYYSEDPLVSGLTAAAITSGVQTQPGVGVTIKHFTGNQQELERQRTNSQMSERTLREIYLKGFEIAVKSAQPMAVMTAYNFVNGEAASGSYDLTEDVLRGEWGYRGLVMTDWGANYDTKQTVYAGNDLIMAGTTSNLPIFDNAVDEVDPTFDLAGLPVYHYVQRTSTGNPIAAHLWNWNTFAAGPGGPETYSVTVDETTDLTQTPQSGQCSTFIEMECNSLRTPLPAWGTVDNAYDWVMEQLDPNHPRVEIATGPIDIGWFTDTERAGIEVTVNSREIPGDETSAVTSYTVSYTGEHGVIRLGDLQRNAMQVLTTLTHAQQFAELAGLQGVGGIEVGPYGALFDGQLATYVSTEYSRVR